MPLTRPLLACCALVALWGSPALAGEARCLWNSLAPATQDRLLATYAGAGAAGLVEVKLESAEARRQMKRCAELGGVVDPKRAVRAMGLALQGFVAQRGAARRLTALGAHSEQQLDLAWAELGPEKRAQLHLLAERRSEGRSADASVEASPSMDELIAILDRASLLSRADPGVQRELGAYVAGRSLQEAFEPRF